MSEILIDVLPVFLLILVGWVIVRTGLLKADVGEAMSEFVFKVAVPLLLFQTIAEANFRGASPFRLWIAYFSGVAVTWAAGHIVATRMFGRDARIGVLAGVSSAFANTIFIGLPLVGRTVGPDGVMAMSILIAVHLPTMMIAGTLLMEQAERKENAGAGRSTSELLRQVGRNLVRNPLVIGLFCGLVVHLTGVPIPATLGTVVDSIANIAGPGGADLARHGAAPIRAVGQSRHHQRDCRLQAASAAGLRTGGGSSARPQPRMAGGTRAHRRRSHRCERMADCQSLRRRSQSRCLDDNFDDGARGILGVALGLSARLAPVRIRRLAMAYLRIRRSRQENGHIFAHPGLPTRSAAKDGT